VRIEGRPTRAGRLHLFDAWRTRDVQRIVRLVAIVAAVAVLAVAVYLLTGKKTEPGWFRHRLGGRQA